MTKILRLRKALIKKTKSIVKSPQAKRAKGAVRFSLKFSHRQIKIRPRARLIFKFVLILAVAFLASSRAVAYLEPKESEVKIGGQAILVAEDKQIPQEQTQSQISQSVGAIRSPFEYAKPIDGPVSQGYSAYHRGMDITSPMGTQIRPVGPGVVRFAGFTPDGRGNEVIVDHGDGLETLYAHMGKIYVGTGNTVATDTNLGTIGLTGRTTGPHVHFEVYEDGVQVNPQNLLP